MAISIKTSEDIEKMRVAGRLAAEVLEMIEPYVKPGVSTGELDRICNDYIVNEQKAISACLGYHGYPKSVCISVNEVVCHGIPDDGKLLKDGDIVNIDVTVIKDDFHGDTSKMFIVGKPTILGERLCRITQESLYLALRMVKPGINLRDHRRGDPEICGSRRFLRGSRVLAGTVSAAASMKNLRCCTTIRRRPTSYSNQA